jgi:hypothetical protein
MLYELYQPYQDAADDWKAAAGAVWDLTSNDLRPNGMTSSDAAGLPILPGLVRCDEVAAGEIDHALRFTLRSTADSYVHPATHNTSTDGTAPMGARFRLRSDFDISTFSEGFQVILRALQQYGMFVADNGTDFGITAEPSESCWVDLLGYEWTWGSGIYPTDDDGARLNASDFEVVELGEVFSRLVLSTFPG